MEVFLFKDVTTVDADGLLLDILEHPEDDIPRLIFADWLEEHGDTSAQARAEFIRLQIHLSRLPTSDESRASLEAQERRLRKRHERQWIGSLREHIHGWAFSRGFLTHLSLEAASLLRNHPLFVRTQPISSIRLTAVRDRTILNRLAQLSYLERLHVLDLSNNFLDRGDIDLLLNSAHLVNLQSLRFNDNPYGYDIVHALADTPELAGLTSLELRRNNLTDATALRLSHSRYLTNLTTLDLRGNIIGSGARERLYALFGDGVRF